MGSARIIAGGVVLIGFLAAPARSRVVGKEVPSADGAKRISSAAVVSAGAVKAADALQAGEPPAPSTTPAIYFDSEKVAASHPKEGSAELYGPALYQHGEKTIFNVHVNRHDKPMDPQYHVYNTHIVYVLEGSATYVSGGKIVGIKPFVDDPHFRNRTRNNVIEGTSIEGGETRHISKGDVLIVPPLTPHWFKEIQSPLSYLEVNVF